MKFYTHVAVKGSNILYRGYENDKRVMSKIPFRPTVFVTSKKQQTEWKTLDGKLVEPYQPGTIRECNDFIKEHRGVTGFEIYGNTEWLYQYIGEEYPKKVEYDTSRMRIAYIDIETESEGGFPNIKTASERVNAITIKVGGKAYVFGLGKFSIPDVKCFQYEDEKSMLKDFLAAWEAFDIDVVTGWNVNFFDIPYLVNRITRLFDEKEAMRLSPWREIRCREVEVMQKKNEVYELLGICILDYFDMYRKFTYVTRESYRLDHIVQVELGERKKQYEGTIHEFHKRDFQRFMEYNLHDVTLVEMLEGKLKLLELCLAQAYDAKVNLNDVFAQVRTWDAIIYHHLADKKIVIPLKTKSDDKEEKFAGAYVKEPIVGSHDWVVSFDLDSLYPHLIMQYNLSPETKTSYGERNKFTVDELLDHSAGNSNPKIGNFLDTMLFKGVTVPGNCVGFSTQKQGFLPELMETMYAERKAYKKKMLDVERELEALGDGGSTEEKQKLKFLITKYYNFQQVRKIQLNSAFGALGNQWCRYYDLEIAEAITLSGQLSIRWIEGCLNRYLNKTLKTAGTDYVVASDTDSVYLRLGVLVKQVLPTETDPQKITVFLNKFCNDILQPFINRQYAKLAEQQNAYSQKMNMKREGICSKGIWTAKKRYMLNVWMGENDVLLDKPKMKIMGIETSRSSTPQIVRDALKKSISLIMNGTEQELVDFVAEFKTDFCSKPLEEIAFPRGCNGMKEYRDDTSIYRKSTPIAVKGALIYNYWLQEKKLTKKYPKVGDGEKVKFVYLKLPNPIRDKVIAFPSEIPKEFGIETKYIDYDTQFEKAFEEPLKTILNVIGWHIRETNSLESMFA